MRNKNAFSLIELLVVIAIIAIMAAILVLAMARIFENTRRAQCGANLAQLSKAFFSFATNNDDFMAPLKFWPQKVAAYMTVKNTTTGQEPSVEDISKAKVMTCPSALKLYKGQASPKKLVTFARNNELNPESAKTPDDDPPYNKIFAPSKTMLVIDSTFITDTWRLDAKYLDYSKTTKPVSKVYETHNSEGVNVGWVDGRASWIKTADMPGDPNITNKTTRSSMFFNATFWRGVAE
jgi:prepilin-type N-terminal cleavage/methylation domain-containing protein